MTQSPLMTLSEFGAKYRVCRATVDTWRRSGLLNCLKIGRRVLITPDQEAEFVARHSKGQHHKEG